MSAVTPRRLPSWSADAAVFDACELAAAAFVEFADFPCELVCVHGIPDRVGKRVNDEITVFHRAGLVEPLHRVFRLYANVSVNKVSPCDCVRIVLGDTGVPFAVPHGDEAVGDVGVGPGKKNRFFDDWFHGR